MHEIVFELCAESIDACIAAREGGAHRIELCSALSEGGVTPGHGLIREAIALSRLPVHVLLRPRGGDFIYTPHELDVMREDLHHARQLGAAGVVLGFLRPDGSVNTAHTKEFVALAGPLEVTFNRAFDQTVSRQQALEDIIAAGCKRLLTSGGESDVLLGADSLARLVSQAADRIQIAVGGGLRLSNAAEVAHRTGAHHFHGSVRRPVETSMLHRSTVILEEEGNSPQQRFTVAAEDIHDIIHTVRSRAFHRT